MLFILLVCLCDEKKMLLKKERLKYKFQMLGLGLQ